MSFGPSWSRGQSDKIYNTLKNHFTQFVTIFKKSINSQTTCQMASKQSYNKTSGGETEQSEEGLNPPKKSCPTDNSSSSSQQVVETFPQAGKKGNDADHGNRFQSKLVILYAVRAINFGFQFYLGTELSVGEKFDDLIFHYKEKNENNYRQQYLQAKHRLNEKDSKKQITENDLLDEKNGDFSLLKYFQSFVKIRGKGNDIEHCIICTNVDFDREDIANKRIKLEPLNKENWPQLLNCNDTKNDQAFWKLKDTGIFKTALFENILNCVTDCTDKEIKSLFQNCNDVVNGKPFNKHTADKMKNFFIRSAQNQNQVEKKIIEAVFNDPKNTSSIRNWIVKSSGKELESLFKNCTEVVNGKPFSKHTANEMKTFFNDSSQNPNQVEKKIIEAVFNDPKNTSSIRNWIVKSSGKELESLFQNCIEVVNNRQFNEHTADEMKTFFIQNRNQVVKKLLEIVFDDFLDKLKFAVKTPNETEVNDILTKEIGKYLKLSNTALQSAYVMNEMINWFKNKDNNWLTPEKAKEILKEKTDPHIKMIELTSLSLDYQKQLKQIKTIKKGKDELEFEDTVIDQWTSKLKSFWDSKEKIKRIKSETPKLTAVKVFSAIKKLHEFPNKDDYLVISSKRLKENQTEIKESLKANINNGHRLLVVVNKEAENLLEDEPYLEFIPDEIKKKVIVISSQNFTKESFDEDTVTYGQLNENTKKVLGEKQVSFQGNLLTVGDLIKKSQLDNELDSKFIENLLYAENEKNSVPSFNCGFNSSLYIQRTLKFPQEDQLLNKLAEAMERSEKEDNKREKCSKMERKNLKDEIHIDSNGKIHWLIDDDKRKKEIWEKFKLLIEQNESKDRSLLNEFHSNNNRIIITGVAGTGKSTILSHYYEEMKKVNPDKLVIKISLMNYSESLTNEKSINEFLINNVMDQNAFARSLLKHRLETGDRIILMLDGFDEIDTKCQDKVVELVKTLNESIPLYITTRPHLADQLQFELSQLAYRLDRFEEENQINYLTSIWEEYLKGVSYNEETIKKFAKNLIKRVSETLKDKEKEFIGIPLQCRILAECFQSKIKDEVNRNPNADLSHLIGDQQFDLVHLYKSLIDEKRRVFRKEKIKENSRKDHIINYSIDYIINKIERHLRKLAIQLIVNQQEDVDILIPVGFQSKSEKKKKEKQLNEFGIRFGLLDDKGDNEMEFLHRTFAEYLVADFILNGFLLDEEKHNNLLENESVRKWIIEEMLVEDNYQGVRVFFDSMLKEEWKCRIQKNHLPLRYQQLSKTFILKENIPALGEAFIEMNSNISLLIFDCLDVTFHENPSEITSFINHSLRRLNIFHQRFDVFDRLLNYFDNAVNDHRQVSQFIYDLIDDLTDLIFALNSENQQIENKILERFLVFVDSHARNDGEFHSKSIREFHQLTVLFIRSKMDEQTRRQFFEFLTSKYSTDFELTRLMKNAIENSLKQHNCQIGEIEKALTILRDFGQIEVAGELSRFVLCYQSEALKKEENVNVRLLEEMGMTGLHGAAFKGDPSLIEKEIGCSLENPENCSEEKRKSVFQLMTNEKDSFPPLYLAAAYGHEDFCKKIFRFLDLKKEISIERGFIHRSLKDAMKYENVVMIQTIFKCVKEILGRNDLIVKLLQSMNYYYKSKLVVESITSVFVHDKENGYRDLNDLVFFNRSTLEILGQVDCDILQKMITAEGGLDNWIKRLMNTNLGGAFDVLSSDGFLDKLNQKNQISKLIDILITKSSPNNRRTILRGRRLSLFTRSFDQPSEPSTSYWSDFVLKKSWMMAKFLTAISKCASEEDLKRFLLYRDDNNILILLQYLIKEGRDEFNKLLTNLPENLRKEIEDLSEEEKSKLIDHFFSTPTFLESLQFFDEQLNAVEYFLENGNEKQLAKFSQVVQVHQLEQEKTENSWKKKKIAGLLKEKLDCQTVIKYKKFIEKHSN